jgi:hypothetical protein
MPVKVVTREDDMRNSTHCPASLHKLGNIRDDGWPTAFTHASLRHQSMAKKPQPVNGGRRFSR